jgi:hypothetical protein
VWGWREERERNEKKGFFLQPFFLLHLIHPFFFSKRPAAAHTRTQAYSLISYCFLFSVGREREKRREREKKETKREREFFDPRKQKWNKKNDRPRCVSKRIQKTRRATLSLFLSLSLSVRLGAVQKRI